jgi:1-phosphofructokinase family hexose kinase
VILAAGLTPAYQQILVFDSLHVGAVNRAREAHFCASGKVLNVGVALHHLGGPSLTLAPSGGISGQSMEEEFRRLGVPARWIPLRRSSRMCTTLLDRGTGLATELVENAAPLDAGKLDLFKRIFAEEAERASMVVLSGSLPMGAPKSLYRDLVRTTRVPLILDASGQELLEALAAGLFCVKPNRQELARTLGRDLGSDADLRDAIAELQRRGAEWTLVSSGAQALWAGHGGRFWRFHPPRIRPVNPIGSGDCLAAAFAWACSRGMPGLEAIQFGIAAAAENAIALLPSRLDPGRVRRRMEEVRLEEA